MNWDHVHIALNHVPVIGSLFALALLAYAMAWKKDDVKVAALGALSVVALSAIVTYLTGCPAADFIQGLPGVSQAVIDRHSDMATAALIVCIVTGAFAGLALVVRPHAAAIGERLVKVALVLSILTVLIMAWTANLGGKVRRPEMRGEAAAPPPAAGAVR
jgi:uncharacterized membrane protein